MDFKPYKLGKYLLLDKLAVGGMAEVYRAKASGAGGFEKHLAVKRVLPNYASNDEFRRMFEFEARLTSQLTHANIVQVYDFVKISDSYLLSMEFVDGKNLRQLLNKAKKAQIQLPIEFSIYIINEVSKGLDYAHNKKDDVQSRPLNIIHRDMSPQNIMLSYEGAVKIVDFGIAKAKDKVEDTRSGVIKGKFSYMSPEQANGEQVDHRSDVFSTGIILMELVTHKRLFTSESDLAILRMIQDCVIPKPSSLNPQIDNPLEKILYKVLSKDKALRYSSAGTFHKALQEYLGKNYSGYTQKDVSDLISKIFETEIEDEKKRLEALLKQTVTFSQGTDQSLSADDNMNEGTITEGENSKSGEATFVGNPNAREEGSAFDASYSNPDFKQEPNVSIELEKVQLNTASKSAHSSRISSGQPLDGPPKLNVISLPPKPSESSIQTQSTEKGVDVSHVSFQTSDKIKSKSLNQTQVAPNSSPPKFNERTEHPSERSSQSSSTGLMGIAATLVIILGGALFWMNSRRVEQETSLASTTVQRGVSQQGLKNIDRSQSSLKAKQAVRSAALCYITADSDPAGARVFIDGTERGLSPHKASYPCLSSASISFQLTGFETEKTTIQATENEANSKVFAKLTKVAMGLLDLYVDTNLKLTIDGSVVQDLTANSSTRIPLRAGVKHILTFENTVFGIRPVTREITLSEGVVKREEVKLSK